MLRLWAHFDVTNFYVEKHPLLFTYWRLLKLTLSDLLSLPKSWVPIFENKEVAPVLNLKENSFIILVFIKIK